jgi:ABC-2 type transport system permease protein
VSNLEYRLNYFVDVIVQPVLTTGIEILLWFAIFKGANSNLIAGFDRANYLSYAMWAAFFARIATSWMYEFKMIEEVGSGTLNSLLVRPLSFYEYYLSQLMGYKFITTLISLLIPIIAAYFFNLPTIYSRIPLAVILCFYYLVLIHTISFLISCAAFYLTKISSFTVAKNLLFWILMGELFPLDMLPLAYKKIILVLPFTAGVFTPVGYIIGRVNIDLVKTGFVSVTISLIVLNIMGYFLWNRALKEYTGTGA